MTKLQILLARFRTHNPRRTRTHLAAAIRAGRPLGLERSEPASADRGASTRSRPSSQALPVRHGCAWRSQDRQTRPVHAGA